MHELRPRDWIHRVEYGLRRVSGQGFVSVGGFKWTVRSANTLKTVRSLGLADPLMGSFFRDASEKDVFLDVGANLGVWTVTAAAGHPRVGHVIAVEPAPGPHWCLLNNLVLNGCARRCTPVAVAVGDHSGLTSFRLDTLDPSTGTSHLAAAHAPAHVPAGALWTPEPVDIVVPMVTVDELIQAMGGTPPSMVKVDVEGHEAAVLAGMATALGTVRRVFVEVHPDRLPVGSTTTTVLDALQRRGFAVAAQEQRGRQVHVLCERESA